jgi:hypothetical protein
MMSGAAISDKKGVGRGGSTSEVVHARDSFEPLFTDRKEDRAKALAICAGSHRHMIRIVGSLPSEKVVKEASKVFLKTLASIPTGPIFIGGTESRDARDSGRGILSIPAIAKRLQALSYTSQQYGAIAPVFGTIPINGRSSLETRHISGDSLVNVAVAEGLQRALVFQGDTEYLWNQEAHGMVSFAAEALKRNGAHLSTIFVGGGRAAELEFNLMRELAEQFPGRVSFGGFSGSGGITDRLIARGEISGIVAKASSLGEHLRRAQLDVGGQDSLEQESENARALRSSIDQLIGGYGNLTAMPPSAELGARHREVSQALGELSEILDYWRSHASSGRHDEDNLRASLLRHKVRGFLEREQPRGECGISGSHDEYVMSRAVSRTKLFLGACASKLPEMDATKSSLDDVVSAVRPLNEIKAGTIVEGESGRHLVLSNRQVLTLGPRVGTNPPIPADAISLFGESGSVSHTVFEAPFSQRVLDDYPDTVPGWNSLQHGGLLQYFNERGEMVAHEELLSVAARLPDGSALPTTERWIEALRVNHKTHEVSYVTASRNIVSLAIPEGWIHAKCSRIAVYPCVAGPHEANQTRLFPSGDVERRLDGDTVRCETALADVVSRMTDIVARAGMMRARHDIARLADEPSEESIRALKGDDPNFERMLSDHKRFFDRTAELRESFGLFVSRVSLSDITNKEVILARIEAVLNDRTRDLGEALEGLLTEMRAHESQSALVNVCAQSVSDIKSLYDELARNQERWSSANPIDIHQGSAPDELLVECARIAKDAELPPDALARDSLAKQFSGGGGLVTNEYTAEYLQRSLSHGAILTVSRTHTGEIEAFSLFYGAGDAPANLVKLHPGLKDPTEAYFDLLCCKRGASPTASLAINRANLVLMQHSATEKFVTITHQNNEPAIRSSLGVGNFINSSGKVIRTIKGSTTAYLVFDIPVSARARATFMRGAPLDRGAQNRVVKSVRAQVVPSGPGLLKVPTPDELSQMRALSVSYGDKTLYRVSLGVASMSPEAKAVVENLIESGVFDDLDGVLVYGAGRLAERRGDSWVIRGGDPASVAAEVSRRNRNIVPVGLAPYNANERAYGTAQPVVTVDGAIAEMAVLQGDGREAGELSVADHSRGLVIKNPVAIDPARDGNLDVWHVEAMRAMTLANYFERKTFVFGAGGSVVAWELNTALDAIEKGSMPNARVVLMSGLGGATDKLAADPELVNRAGAYEARTGRKLFTVVSVQEPAQVKEALG